MATIAQASQNWSRIANQAYLTSILLRVIKETEPIAISLQKQQLEEGYNNEEQEIGRYKASSQSIYESEGRTSNKPKIEGELFNFDDTGDFLEGIQLKFTNKEVSFFSTDSKTPELIGKYRNLFGLDPYNFRNYIVNSVLPKFIFQLRKDLKLI
ncbi:structural protein/putative neck protein [Cellulophaga phage Nekkels_1]|uniref:Structural protein/putative neck protein n=1 Tax=Cellulophaga phage Nekkels_1 TaxID=2745692 RepID=A0A8E4UXH0_9CAUD|nr:tail protein [Cellulophaga phage Nekkels_1]QQO97048.1 structural protein/putative neck protein [Cellulophaga phage Nekkels_1]QQO97141.1 structural protein [Cellulophaga phage Nekkels_2]